MNEASSAPWPPTSTAWTVAILLMLANTFSFVDRQILSLLVEPIKADLHISDTEISLLYGFSFTLFYISAGIPMAYVADRSNRRNIVILSILVWSLATSLCGLARSFAALFAARIGVGAGEGGLTPASFSMLSDLFPREKLPIALSVNQAGIYIGNASALLIGGLVATIIPPLSIVVLPVLGALKGWHLLFLALGLPGILLAFVFLLAAEPVRRGVASQAEHVPVSQFFTHMGRFRLAYAGIIIGFALMVLVGNGTQFWIPAMVQRKFGWTTSEVGYVFGLVAIFCGGGGIIAGGVVAGWLSGSEAPGSNLHTCMIGFVALVPLTIAFPLMPTAFLTFVLIGGMQFFAGFNFGGGLSALQDLTPNRMRARMSLLYMLVLNVFGAMLGPTAMGWMSDAIFKDPHELPIAIALTCVVVSPLAVLALAVGVRAYRKAIVESRLQAA